MRSAFVCIVLTCGGCARYAQVQIDLLEQAHRGVVQTQQSLDEKSRIVSAYYDLQRKRLDDAFDADVQARTPLDVDWVIESRKAYAAGVQSIDQARAAATTADQAQQQTLSGIDEALTRVQWLQSLQIEFTSLPKELNHDDQQQH